MVAPAALIAAACAVASAVLVENVMAHADRAARLAAENAARGFAKIDLLIALFKAVALMALNPHRGSIGEGSSFSAAREASYAGRRPKNI